MTAFACSYSGRAKTIEALSMVPVTGRATNDTLYYDLKAVVEQGKEAHPRR
jgi:hypothetical protein